MQCSPIKNVWQVHISLNFAIGTVTGKSSILDDWPKSPRPICDSCWFWYWGYVMMKDIWNLTWFITSCREWNLLSSHISLIISPSYIFCMLHRLVFNVFTCAALEWKFCTMVSTGDILGHGTWARSKGLGSCHGIQSYNALCSSPA